MERWQFQQRFNLPLDLKIKMSQIRIKSWYDHWIGEIYVSFSGGKDSTVLLHLVRSLYPKVPAVFVDTGLEYPEVRDFVKTIDNVLWLKPKMSFRKVIEKYGFPVISKENAQKTYEIRNTNSEKLRNKRLNGDDRGHGKLPEKWKFLIDAPFKISNKCCDALKKNPIKKYEKESKRKPITGLMAQDSALRKANYLKNGCNVFTGRPMSTPLSFWSEANIWEYLKAYDLEYSSIYGKLGHNQTGCMFCCFGVHLEKEPNKFQRMERNHPAQYRYCMDKLGLKNVLKYISIPYRNKTIEEELEEI